MLTASSVVHFLLALPPLQTTPQYLFTGNARNEAITFCKFLYAALPVYRYPVSPFTSLRSLVTFEETGFSYI